MALVEQQQSKNELIDRVYSIVRENSGKVRTAELDHAIGNKQDVRFALTRLTVMGKISRRRGFGKKGVEYYYHDTASESFSKYRRMDLRSFGHKNLVG